MKFNHLKFLVLFVSLLGLTACHKDFNKLLKSGSVEEKYKASIKYYEEADYYRAGVLFEEITPYLKGDSLAEKVQFYNAYCNYYQGLFQMSSYLFKTFYSTYNNSPFAEEAFYMYSYSLFKDAPDFNLDQTSTLTAIDALQTFINTYPDSKYVKTCTENLEELRVRLEKKAYEKAKLYYLTSGVTVANYKAAVITIDNFKREFPDSDYNEELSYLQIKSQYELAENSIFSKQKERYTDAINRYQLFQEKYQASKYMKELSDIYEDAQKKLTEVVKTEAEIELAKKENRPVNESALGKM